MHPRWCAAALACSALLALPSAARGADGTFTQVLCANPETGMGTGVPGLPQGMSNPGTNAVWQSASPHAACSGAVHGGQGIPLFNGMGGHTASGVFTALRWEAAPGIELRGGTLFRSLTTRDGLAPLAINQHGGANAADVYGLPRGEDQGDYHCCPHTATRGTTSHPWHGANRVTLTHDANRWNVTAEMRAHGDIPASKFTYRLYGGRLTLRDASHPHGAVSGDLADPSVTTVAGDVTGSVNATDSGSGVYRAVLLADGVVRQSFVVDGNDGRCADLNTGNGDPYEFAYQTPCRSSASRDLSFDSRSLSDGPHRLKLVLEDAGGNQTTLLDRRVAVDNVPAPSLTSAPEVTGTARDGRTLQTQGGAWNGHGAQTTVRRVWQRCTSAGANCEDVPGRIGALYDLGGADVGRRLRVVEVATSSEGSRQAVSELSPIVARADGTLPVDGNGVDDDGDGRVDESGEQAPGGGTGGTGGPGGSGGTATSGAGATPGGSGGTATSGAGATPGGSGGTSTSSSSTSSTATRSTSATSTSTVATNGEGASARARLTVAFRGAPRTRRFAVPFGRSAVIVGRLVDEAGRPIRGATVEVAETVRVRGARGTAGPSVQTGPDGSFRYTVTRRASNRRLVFAYRHVRGGEVVTQDDLELDVRPGVRLRVSLAGAVVRYRGQVLAGAMPRTGKVVVLQGRVAGGRWQTFATRRARGAGRFRGRYRLNVRRPGQRLQFRARVLAESGWPYLAATSRVVTRRVR